MYLGITLELVISNLYEKICFRIFIINLIISTEQTQYATLSSFPTQKCSQKKKFDIKLECHNYVGYSQSSLFSARTFQITLNPVKSLIFRKRHRRMTNIQMIIFNVGFISNEEMNRMKIKTIFDVYDVDDHACRIHSPKKIKIMLKFSFKF